jgi:hypothetical protein
MLEIFDCGRYALLCYCICVGGVSLGSLFQPVGSFMIPRLALELQGFPTCPHLSLALKVSLSVEIVLENPNLLLMINCMHYFALIGEFLRLQ